MALSGQRSDTLKTIAAPVRQLSHSPASPRNRGGLSTRRYSQRRSSRLPAAVAEQRKEK